ncbi:putative disease resistance RPP13-like protein 3 [Punica granatum]|uniref:Disease resistance RPP13-like protein 3 n=1 Tax=Punica granatum TaxID=22663 RepID=A0A6P8DWP9_PUNGR|nr:putative disease resistance RPP13-like protein 3 [Punica granatum]
MRFWLQYAHWTMQPISSCWAEQKNATGIIWWLAGATIAWPAGWDGSRRTIEQIFPAATMGAQWNSPPLPLPDRQPPDDLTNIRRHCSYNCDNGNNLMPTQDEARQGMFNRLVYSKESRVLILYGRRGAGKTTLMRYLYDRGDIIKDYPCRAWVSIHENLRYKDILLEMIGQVGKSGTVIDHMKEEDKLVVDLFKLLSRFNRYLIVLDNCTPKIWPKLMECLPNKGDGSRVVITTSEPILGFMQNQGNIKQREPTFMSVITIDELKAREKWKFLLDLVREKSLNQYDQELEACIQESSPRASVFLAGALNTQWQDNVQHSVESIKARVEGASDRNLSLEVTLKWSYHSLHPLVKASFLFLSIFPEGSEVPLRRVHYLWLSEGFLDNDETNRELAPHPMSPRQLARVLFGILVNRKLVEVTKWKLDGSPKMCRIPISVHDFASETLKSTSLFNVYNHSVNGAPLEEGSCVRRMVSHQESEIPRMSMHHHLRAYVSFHKKAGGKLNEEINLHLKTLTAKWSLLLLKLLDLESVYKPKLPDSIGKMLYLRFLGLRSTLLDSIPTSISKLQCLETLDLKHTNVTNLPSSLVKSKQLRHLHAKEVPLDAFIPGLCQYHCLPCACVNWQQSSSNLETLTGLYIGSSNVDVTSSHLLSNLQELEVTCNIQKTTVIEQLISEMVFLRSLKLNSTDTAHQYSFNLSGHRNLEKIYLRCKLEREGNQQERPPTREGDRPPHPLEGRFPLGLRELTLSMSALEEDPMPILGELDCLVVLKLFAKSYMGTEMKCKGFPRLRVLKVWKLPQLDLLTIEPRSMPCLEEMEIRRCHKMQKLVGSENLQSTINVLVLCDMPKKFREEVEKQEIIQKTTIKQTSEECDNEEEPAPAHPAGQA